MFFFKGLRYFEKERCFVAADNECYIFHSGVLSVRRSKMLFKCIQACWGICLYIAGCFLLDYMFKIFWR